ncbi:MAG: heat-inducible transcription repressor HrcA [Actinobacteria bacterium]|nr:heat-inducible transcription repressor HrcA [Actinomycetota bacterium]
MLTERRQQVLDALVNEYVACAIPVGSRTLVERYRLGVSAATVRSELAGLEETGYVVSPHTSAGRIPTDSGYRSFVDNLLVQEDLLFDDGMVGKLTGRAEELDDLIQITCGALMNLTSCLAVVLARGFERILIKRISLVSLSPRRGIAVVITKDGQVLNRHLEFPDETDSARLEQIERLFNSAFDGLDSADVNANVMREVMGASNDLLVYYILSEIIDLFNEGDSNRIHHLGMSALLSQPEFRNSRQVIPLASALEDNKALLSLFSGTFDSTDTVVRIGHENTAVGLGEVSLVAQGYSTGSAQGLIAVIGPTRMDYAKAISAVHTVSHIFEEVL